MTTPRPATGHGARGVGSTNPFSAWPWRQPQALAPGQSAHIRNAGLVLLAPLVPRWFRLLGLLAAAPARGFGSEEAAARAVHLLQWLVDTRTDTDEHLLVLNKLLCGLAPAVPVPLAITPEPAETGHGLALLEGVITHWTALGRTSVAGLRETFLQREGRLLREESGWRLQVAARPFDMLLDRLPWGMAVIKLPWMPEVLHVDWR
jgi:hypothetical protein